MQLKIIRFKNVKSTNDKAIKLIQTGKITSGLITADLQTNGRGTMGKKWISVKGNIFISIFFKVNFTKIKIANFLIINAKIIKKILKNHTKKKITIKKPNDLLIEKRKLCGILQEVVDFKNDKYLITGFGINTLISPLDKEYISTCLQEHAKLIIKNLSIIENIKNTYEKIINEFENNNFTSIKKKYI